MLKELHELFLIAKEKRSLIMFVGVFATVLGMLIANLDLGALFEGKVKTRQEPKSSCPPGATKIEWSDYQDQLCVDTFGNLTTPNVNWP